MRCRPSRGSKADTSTELRLNVYRKYFAALNQLHQSHGGQPLAPLLEPGQLNVPILGVSKSIHEEAVTVYYQETCFATSVRFDSGLELYHRDNTLQGVPLGTVHYNGGLEQEHQARRSFPAAEQATLKADVAKIFTSPCKDLPKWLFGGHYVRRPLAYRGIKRPSVPGYSFARFLRHVGSSKAENIRHLRINALSGEQEIGHLDRACYDFPLYSEIIRQHLPNVTSVVLGMKFPVQRLLWDSAQGVPLSCILTCVIYL